MDKPIQVAPDIVVLPAHFPIPGMGFLPINAFVIKAKEPVIVDTGMGIDSKEFLEAIQSIVDPNDVKWVWLTHDDIDHTGSIQNILNAAPNARLVTNPLAALRMSTAWAVPMNRVYWLNSGESITAGDRTLTAVRPPLFDNPMAIGIHDAKADVFISVDCFGAIIPSPAENVEDLQDEVLAQGMTGWATADSPWVHMVDTNAFGQALEKVRRMAPKTVLSSHLPPAQGKVERLLEILAGFPTSTPFVGPNQAALEQILAQTAAGS